MNETTTTEPIRTQLQSLADQFWPDVRPDGTAGMPRIRVGYPTWLRSFLQPGVAGITLGRTVYLAPSVGEYRDEAIRRIVRHELAHVAQFQRLGMIRFLLCYVWEYARHRLAGRSAPDAYRNISFELEAVRAERGSGETRYV